MAAFVSLGEQLIRTYNLQNVNIIPQPKNDYQINQAVTIDKPLYTSALGTPVLADLTFGIGEPGAINTYTDESGNQGSFETVRLETVLISLNQSKNIVKTQIQGRAGTIKEYVGLGDYSLSINGILTGSNGSYPKDQLMALKTVLTAPISIPVVSWYLQMFDIDFIVIDGFDADQAEGAYSQQAFTINACSDTGVFIVLNPTLAQISSLSSLTGLIGF